MEAQVLHEVRSSRRAVQLVLIRANGALFYSVAAAALLESNVEACAERMVHYFAADKTLCSWIRNEWQPGKAARARALREYVETTWPEFDFATAMEDYRAAAQGEGGMGPRRPSGAHEALARCIAAAQSALFYRCLARWAEDTRLRDLAHEIAVNEASSLPRFRAAFERRARMEGLGFMAAWRAAMTFARTSRDVQLPLAFTCLAAQWRVNASIVHMGYDEFVTRMRAVVERYGALGTAERVLFRPWLSRPRVRARDAAPSAPAWFKPFFRAAA